MAKGKKSGKKTPKKPFPGAAPPFRKGGKRRSLKG